MSQEQAPFAVHADVQSALEALWANGHAAFVVGGAIRDALLRIPTADWDVTTDAEPERVLAIFPDGTYQNRFGTVRLGELDITTFRRDHRYADHRRPERVTFSDDIFEDLARRDLTINAIAWGRSSPTGTTRWVDPADGLKDLKAGLVRAVGDPSARFDEDALRLLRAVRIAAHLEFTIEPRTLEAMQVHAGDITWVSEERIATEVRRMLASAVPSRALRLMLETGILAPAIPELATLVGRERADGTASDPFTHALATLDRATAAVPGNEPLALAALFHPTGQGSTRVALRRLHVRGRDIDIACRLVAEVHVDYEPTWTGLDVRRFMRRLGPALVEDLVRLREAHDGMPPGSAAARRTSEFRARLEEQQAAHVPLTLGDLAIDGSDVREELGITEGPLVGDILTALLDLVLIDPSVAQRESLLREAHAILERTPERTPERADMPITPRASGHRVGSAE
jgi:tRNA nucleotidyltransferase/poly(A) polymerase